ncbi:TPA: hypothetical protein ACVOYT_004555 [Vibrio diabolicus]
MRDKLLKFSAFGCCVVIFLFEFQLSDTPEMFKGGAKLAELVVGLCVSYLAAYIFYLVTIEYPYRKRKEHLSEYLATLVIDVRESLDIVVCGLINKPFYQYEKFDLDSSKNEIRQVLSKVYLSTESNKNKHVYGKQKEEVGEFVSRNLVVLDSAIRELANNSDYVEQELIKIISILTQNPIKKEIPYLHNCKPTKIGENWYQDAKSLENLAEYTENLIEYIEAVNHLDKILKEKYAKTQVVQTKYEDKWKKAFG